MANIGTHGVIRDPSDVTNGAELPGFEPAVLAEGELDAMLEREGLSGLPEENKKAIKVLLRIQRAMRTTDAKKEMQSRIVATGMKKPTAFTPATMSVRQFICGYEAYVNVIGFNEATTIEGFVTYLDPKSQERVLQSTDLDKSSWKAYKKDVLNLLEDSSKYSELNARFNIRNIKQKVGETVHEFGQRLRDQGNIGFPGSDDHTIIWREAVLKDALAAGIAKDEVGIQIIRRISSMTFNELLREAVTLDISYQAREQIRSRSADIVENVGIAVLRTQTEAEGPRHQQYIDNRNDDSCLQCGEWGHLRRDCWQFESAQRNENRGYNDPNTHQGRERHNDCYCDQYEDDYAPRTRSIQQRERQRMVNQISELTVRENQQHACQNERDSEYN